MGLKSTCEPVAFGMHCMQSRERTWTEGGHRIQVKELEQLRQDTCYSSPPNELADVLEAAPAREVASSVRTTPGWGRFIISIFQPSHICTEKST